MTAQEIKAQIALGLITSEFFGMNGADFQAIVNNIYDSDVIILLRDVLEKCKPAPPAYTAFFIYLKRKGTLSQRYQQLTDHRWDIYKIND